MPMQMMDHFAQLLNNLPGMIDDQDLKDALDQLFAHQRASEMTAEGAMNRARAAPPPQTDPFADAIARSASRMGAAFLGHPNPHALSDQVIGAEQTRLNTGHDEELARLNEQYKTATQSGQMFQNLGAQAQMQDVLARVSGRRANAAKLASDERGFGYDKTLANIKGQWDVRTAEARARAANKDQQEDPATIKILTDSVLSNQSNLTNYSKPVRTQIVTEIANQHESILPNGARNALNAINAATSVLDQMEPVARRVTASTPGGLGRFVVGARKGFEGLKQTPGAGEDVAMLQRLNTGFLSALSRGLGQERGNLSDQDVARARALMVNINTSKGVSERALTMLRNHLQDLRERTVSTYSSQLPEQSRSKPDPLGIR